MDRQGNDIPEINIKVTTQEIKAKVRKLPSHESAFVDAERGIHLIYDNTKYSLEDIKKEVEKLDKERTIYHYVDYPTKI